MTDHSTTQQAAAGRVRDDAARLAMRQALGGALRRDEFRLLYQPRVSCFSGQVTGVEALLRWDHPEFGQVPSSRFIPLLEDAGLIVPVGEWVLRTAMAQARQWRDLDLPALNVSVNLSTQQLRSSRIVRAVEQALADAQMPASMLELELTETWLMDRPAIAERMLQRLHRIGVRLTLDNFGSGHCNLSYISRFPIDGLKIARGFVRELTTEPIQATITQVLIRLAHSLNLDVVAEGVETAGQLSMLMRHGCNAFQGYLFSRPVEGERIAALLREGRRLDPAAYWPQMRDKTLLLVDDEENIRNAIRRLLRRTDYRVLTAASGDEGLRILAENAVDVVVSDQRMPGMSGAHFLRCVKEMHPSVVRIVLSGFTDLQSVTDLVNAGAVYRFLTKPWDDPALLASIHDAFRHKAGNDERLAAQAALVDSHRRLAEENAQLLALLADSPPAPPVAAAPAGGGLVAIA